MRCDCHSLVIVKNEHITFPDGCSLRGQLTEVMARPHWQLTTKLHGPQRDLV